MAITHVLYDEIFNEFPRFENHVDENFFHFKKFFTKFVLIKWFSNSKTA